MSEQKELNKIARDTAKGLWPGEGSVGQNEGLILQVIQDVLALRPPDLNAMMVRLKEKCCACNLASGPDGWNIWVGKVGHRVKFEGNSPLDAVEKALKDTTP